MSLESLKEKAAVYAIPQEYIDAKESGRLQFIEKFPKERIAYLTPDEYVLGGEDKDSFSYWLEFKKINGENATIQISLMRKLLNGF